MRRATIVLFTLILAQSTPAQISHWQLGGSGLAWSENDTTRLFVDFATTPRCHPAHVLHAGRDSFFPHRQLGLLARPQ